MTPIEIIAIMVFSMLFTSVFVVGLRTKGPWGSAWTFFVIIALTLSTVTLWVPPAGPVWYGAPWVDLLITGLLISFIMSAVSPSQVEYHSKVYEGDVFPSDHPITFGANSINIHKEGHQKTIISAGSFFWMLLFVLSVLIIVGLT